MSHLLSLYALALLLGGITFFSAIVAPLVFLRLPAETAGRFIRDLFPWYYLYILVFAGLAMLTLLWEGGRPWALVAMILVFVLGAYSRQTLMPAINRARDAALAGDPSAALEFSSQHRRSVIINTVQWGLVLGIFALLTRPAPYPWTPQPIAKEHCEAVRGWVNQQGRSTLWPKLAEDYRSRRVWLLGEQHDQAAHHAWQLQVLTSLHARDPKLVLAMEMFPRESQAALDAWIAGKSSWDQFLRDAQWERVWGFEAALYRPLLEYAQRNQIPLLALNISPELARKVGDLGWESLPEAEREGISKPAPARRQYRDELRQVFEAHHAFEESEARIQASSNWAEDPSKSPVNSEQPAPSPPTSVTPHPQAKSATQDEAFARFLDVQLLWDRAMAEAIAERLEQLPDHATVVAILGRGHIGPKRGVGLQLADLGVTDVVSLLPTTATEICALKQPRAKAAAQAYFVLPETEALATTATTSPSSVAPRPRLGVELAVEPQGVRIVAVMSGSLAEREGLQVGDLITHLAEQAITSPQQMVTMIQAQPAGTWLPIRLMRDDEERRQVIRFPAPSAED